MNHVTAPWFMFMDGDDWLESDTCEKLFNEIDEQDEICIFGIFRDTDKVKLKFPMTYLKKSNYKGQECKGLRKKVLNYNNYISTAYAKLYQTEFIKKHKIYHDKELRSGIEGIEFCYRLFDSVSSVKTIDYYGYHYLYNEDSLSARPSEKSNQLILMGLKKIEKYILTHFECQMDIGDLYIRAAYTILATATRSYFNIQNKYSFSNRKIKMTEFLETDIIERSIEYIETNKVDFPKKRLYSLIISHHYRIVYLYSILSWLKKHI